VKISLPTLGNKGLDETVGEHFGRVPTYTVVNLNTDEVKIISNTSHHMGGYGDPPEIMAREGVSIMVCQGLGRRAISMFERLGITVYIGASGTVRDALNMFKQGNLQKASESDGCAKHAFKDRSHD
jgi:predicted Fe-Mo cluster-binding NifX family protein